MALNKGNKSLRDLMAARNKMSTSKKATKSQVPPTLPPPPPSLPVDLGLKVIPDLKKKGQFRSSKKERWALKRGLSSRRWPKILGIRVLLLLIAGRSKIGPMCASRSAPGLLGQRLMELPSVGMPQSGTSNGGVRAILLKPWSNLFSSRETWRHTGASSRTTSSCL